MLGPPGVPSAITARPPGMMPTATPQVGAGVTAQGNPGLAVKAMHDVSAAIKLLEGALPNIPMGSPLHTEVLNSVKSLVKHQQDAGEANPQAQIMALMNALRGAQQSQPMAALMRMGGGQPQPALGAPSPAAAPAAAAGPA